MKTISLPLPADPVMLLHSENYNASGFTLTIASPAFKQWFTDRTTSGRFRRVRPGSETEVEPSPETTPKQRYRYLVKGWKLIEDHLSTLNRTRVPGGPPDDVSIDGTEFVADLEFLDPLTMIKASEKSLYMRKFHKLIGDGPDRHWEWDEGLALKAERDAHALGWTLAEVTALGRAETIYPGSYRAVTSYITSGMQVAGEGWEEHKKVFTAADPFVIGLHGADLTTHGGVHPSRSARPKDPGMTTSEIARTVAATLATAKPGRSDGAHRSKYGSEIKGMNVCLQEQRETWSELHKAWAAKETDKREPQAPGLSRDLFKAMDGGAFYLAVCLADADVLPPEAKFSVLAQAEPAIEGLNHVKGVSSDRDDRIWCMFPSKGPQVWMSNLACMVLAYTNHPGVADANSWRWKHHGPVFARISLTTDKKYDGAPSEYSFSSSVPIFSQLTYSPALAEQRGHRILMDKVRPEGKPQTGITIQGIALHALMCAGQEATAAYLAISGTRSSRTGTFAPRNYRYSLDLVRRIIGCNVTDVATVNRKTDRVVATQNLPPVFMRTIRALRSSEATMQAILEEEGRRERLNTLLGEDKLRDMSDALQIRAPGPAYPQPVTGSDEPRFIGAGPSLTSKGLPHGGAGQALRSEIYQPIAGTRATPGAGFPSGVFHRNLDEVPDPHHEPQRRVYDFAASGRLPPPPRGPADPVRPEVRFAGPHVTGRTTVYGTADEHAPSPQWPVRHRELGEEETKA